MYRPCCRININLLSSDQQSASLSTKRRVHASLMQVLLAIRKHVLNVT
jgi:hypothetical protein